jgi:DNA-binding PadR family transcriptional regulator
MVKPYAGSRSGGEPPFDGERVAAGLWEVFDGAREAIGRRMSQPRMGRGDVRTAILALLAEEPMHGYQVIGEIAKRSGGMWRPSPGSVYPTLQLLADEGLVRAEETGERKTYALTDAGHEVAEDAAGSLPWESPALRHAERAAALPKAGVKLAQALAQVARSGSPDAVEQAVAIVDEARRKVYAILAES